LGFEPGQTVAVAGWPDPSWAYAPLFTLERSRLRGVLDTLGAADWGRATPCPGWSVLGLAIHLVGDDLSFLAWQRDNHHGTPSPEGLDEQGFIAWLDELQIEWVHAARRLSPRLVADLLSWLGDQVADTVAGQDPAALAANVSWASATAAPVWLDQVRELSERWIHRQQILQSIDRQADLRADLAEPVLDGLRWAYRYRLAVVRRPRGSRVAITVTGPEFGLEWNLVSDGQGWEFDPTVDGPYIARLQMSTDQAWRLLTNNFHHARHGAPICFGDNEVCEVLVRTRAIIGEPK
jgi:uncharacterized protein (TIGR03083 family)